MNTILYQDCNLMAGLKNQTDNKINFKRDIFREGSIMDFELTEEQAMLRLNARNFLRKEILPLLNEYEKEYRNWPKEDICNRYNIQNFFINI